MRRISLIAAIVLSWIPILPVICLIVAVVLGVQELIGLYNVGKDILLCKVSFFLRIAGMAITVLTVLIPQISVLGYITSIISFVAPLLMIGSVTKILKERGAASVAKLGMLSFWFSIGTDVGLAVLFLLPLAFSLLGFGITGILFIILFGVAIATLIIYMLFLKRGAEQFCAFF